MFLTIKELAEAANVSQGLLRQHIQRNHLRVDREDGRVSVAVDEARRWARQRGLTLSLSAVLPETHGDAVSRSARVAVLAWHSESGDAVNLFTHVRHRSQASLGPWARRPDGVWSSLDLSIDDPDCPGEVKLHVVDISFGHLEELLEDVFTRGELRAAQTKIGFKLHATPRGYRAFRDFRDGTSTKVVSPFSGHSAEVFEYWSFEGKPLDRWLNLVETQKQDIQPLLARLGFPLDRLSDRAGNLMIAGALDAIDCNLSAQRNGTLLLSVDGVEFRPHDFTAVAWASHSDDEVLRLTIPLARNETVLNLSTEIDRLGFAVHRNRDGACMDLLDERLMMEVSIALNFEAGPALHVRDRKEQTIAVLSPFSSRSLTKIELEEEDAEMDYSIRREVLDRRAREADAAARRHGGPIRFEPYEFEDAVDYFLSLLSDASHRSEPIYLADPHFTNRGPATAEQRLFLGMFDATKDMPMRILCGEGRRQAWWRRYPSVMTHHVEARMFQRSWKKSAFHDRYVVTPEKEILITNSFNNWINSGVTFDTFSHGVYRAGAEALWSMQIGASDKSINVYEVQ